jgi:hypothetical protein
VVEHACNPNTQKPEVGGLRVQSHSLFFFLKRKESLCARWLTPVILATQETVIRKITVQSQPWANPGKSSLRLCLEKTHDKKGLLE